MDRLNLNRILTKAMIDALCTKASLSPDYTKMKNVGSNARDLVINHATFLGFVNSVTNGDLAFIGDTDNKVLVPAISNNDLTDWGKKFVSYIKTHVKNYHYICSNDDVAISPVEEEVLAADPTVVINPGELEDVKDADKIVNHSTLSVNYTVAEVDTLKIDGSDYTEPIAVESGDHTIKAKPATGFVIESVKIGKTVITLDENGEGSFTVKENAKTTKVTITTTAE